MPYASTSELPQAVRSKLKGAKLRQWMHVWNSSYARHKDESRAFAEAWATVQKAEGLEKVNGMNDFSFFMPIAKINQEKRTVSGYASTPREDSDGEIVTLDAVKAALPDYMNWRNIREMHALKAVGTAEEANLDGRGLYLTAKIADDQAWKKCLEGVYKGFSIGGRKLAKDGNKITKLEMTEISVVDRPANPDCRLSIAKSAGTSLGAEGYLVKPKAKLSAEQKALAKMAKIVTSLAKSDNPPAAHDGFSLPAKKAEDSGGDDKTKCAAHGRVDCEECMDKREFNAEERRDAADSGAALPDGSFPIKNAEDLSNAIQAIGRAKNPSRARAHIRSRAKTLGLESKIPDSWNGKAKTESKTAKKLAKAELNRSLGLGGASRFLSLKKGMRTVGSLSYCFDSLRDAQRSLMLEGKREGGDMKDQALAKDLGSIAKQLATVISQKATHEAGEALDLSDADDQYLNTILGDSTMETGKMVKTVDDTHGDPLTDAVAELMKRASQPTKAMRLAAASDDMTKARKAMKECRKALEECHKLHKAAFLAKAAKKKDKDDDDEDDKEFDHAGAMEKLQKAYGEIEKARTFGKAAIGQLAKAQSVSGRSGQRGEEVSDPEGKHYQVPAGVRDLSPIDLAAAPPGGEGRGSIPPNYPVDTPYPGKAASGNDLAKFAKNGMISTEVAELMMKSARAEAELEALKRLPAVPSGGRRPYTFDLTKVGGGSGGSAPSDLNKALFDGVDPNALNGTDELAHTQASARVIGNMLTSGVFGKSVFDGSFRGAAGSAK